MRTRMSMNALGLTLGVLAVLALFGCQSPTEDKPVAKAAVVEGTVTLPADATGKAYFVRLGTTLGQEASGLVIEGTVSGSSIPFSFKDVPEGTYFVFSVVDVTGDWTEDQAFGTGDYVGAWGATSVATVPRQANVVVPATGTVTADFTAVLLAGSSDATLSALEVTGGNLSPSFDPQVTGYGVSVPYSTKQVTVTATLNDKKALLLGGDGVYDLDVGSNKVSVGVFAEDGTQSQYSILIVRASATGATITGTVTLPAEIEEGSWAVVLDQDTDGSNGNIALDEGGLSGRTFQYGLTGVPAGTYYLYMVANPNSDTPRQPVAGDDIGYYNRATMTTPNVVVDANAALVLDIGGSDVWQVSN